MDVGSKRTSSETFSRLFFDPILCFLFSSYQIPIPEVQGKYKEIVVVTNDLRSWVYVLRISLECLFAFEKSFGLEGGKL